MIVLFSVIKLYK